MADVVARYLRRTITEPYRAEWQACLPGTDGAGWKIDSRELVSKIKRLKELQPINVPSIPSMHLNKGREHSKDFKEAEYFK